MNLRNLSAVAIAAGLLVGLAACDQAGPSNAVAPVAHSDGTSGGGVVPRLITGNIPGEGGDVCMDPRVNPTGAAWIGIKVDPPVAGNFGGFAITLDPTGTYLDWAAIGANVMHAFVIKGGPDTHVYDYNPPPFTSDTGLHSPLVGGGNVPEISHYVFCYTEVEDDEGCTPGYWKNHTNSWGPTGLAPGQTVGSVFAAGGFPSLASATLLQGLSFQGGSGTGGAAQILLRAAISALLNASHPDVDYPRTAAAVIADVNAALASNSRSTMLTLATALDNDNNLGCPLN